jgi:trk system potassium uptake protein
MTISRRICLGFGLLILLGTLMLAMPIASTQPWNWHHWLIALFTATSAVCVTGHSVVDTGSYFTGFGQIVILLLVQIGGLGYMTVTTFLLLLLGRRFGLREKVAISSALDRPGLQGSPQILRSIVATTVLFELTGVIGLWLAFMGDNSLNTLVDGRYATPISRLGLATFLSISAWNNAGFSPMPDNLMHYQSHWGVNGVITLLIILGGLGYEVLFEGYLWLRDRWCGQLGRLSLHFKVAVSTTMALLVVGTVGTLMIESHNPKTLAPLGLPAQILTAWFQSVTSRTAGFNTMDITQMSTAGLFLTMALMFVGGSPGSTAGGIKTTTLRILTQCSWMVLRGETTVHLYGRQIQFSLVLKAIAVVVGSISVVMGMTMLITIFDPEMPFVEVLFDVISAFATVGLSNGLTMDAQLSDASKLVIVAGMYIGRVGVLLGMNAVVGERTTPAIGYPNENLLVG